ncbi:DUF1931 family protein [Devosia sp. ZB163]|uniref:DUF1931 family protein n=1 Tax=Devosia sp. ZB163 TaxID=3025938 RepID=UPI00235FCE3C|nr:DUF1931 family protein [Devosia sp. ZB163]MDC9823476.1 DUF1931 family protein [Devosia sp. ZB163]
MPVLGVKRLEHVFAAAASLDVDKSDLKRHDEFLARKIADMLLRGNAIANANAREVIEPQDLPITKGLQERMHEFRALDDANAEEILAQKVAIPPGDWVISDDTMAMLPEVAGGLSVALAKSFKVIDPDLKNPQTEHWDRAFELFDLLL